MGNGDPSLSDAVAVRASVSVTPCLGLHQSSAVEPVSYKQGVLPCLCLNDK